MLNHPRYTTGAVIAIKNGEVLGREDMCQESNANQSLRQSELNRYKGEDDG